MTVDLYVLAGASGLLAAATPSAAGSAGVFVVAMAAGARVDLRHGFAVVVLGVAGMGAGTIAYHGSGVALLAYTAAWCAMAFGGANKQRLVGRRRVNSTRDLRVGCPTRRSLRSCS
jgi:hypothetical protein